MAKRSPKRALIWFPERHALPPVLRAKEDSVTAAERDELQERTRMGIERFRSHGSAAAVVTSFNRDLHPGKVREERLGIKGGHG